MTPSGPEKLEGTKHQKKASGCGYYYVTRSQDRSRAKSNKHGFQLAFRDSVIEAAEDADCALVELGYFPANFPEAKLEKLEELED